MTDSSCDLPASFEERYGLSVIPLSVVIDGKTFFNYLDGREIGFKEYYALLRQGKKATTSAVNIDAAVKAMEIVLESGKDILFLAFSSGLSCTYASADAAAKEMSARYPDRKVYVVDTLCASLGQGLMVYLAAQQKESGKSMEEVRDFVEKNKLHLCHWFTVEDLHHLKRGGRISAATALVGTALGIKPVMHMDNNGKLASVGKVRGRQESIKALAQKMKQSAIDAENQTVFISHGDCEDDAKTLASIIKDDLKVKDIMINYVGPVIGTHSGPGTLALFFIGSER